MLHSQCYTDPPPTSLLTQLCLPLLFYIHQDLFVLFVYILRCVAFHWSMANYQGLYSQNSLTFPLLAAINANRSSARVGPVPTSLLTTRLGPIELQWDLFELSQILLGFLFVCLFYIFEIITTTFSLFFPPSKPSLRTLATPFQIQAPLSLVVIACTYV